MLIGERLEIFKANQGIAPNDRAKNQITNAYNDSADKRRHIKSAAQGPEVGAPRVENKDDHPKRNEPRSEPFRKKSNQSEKDSGNGPRCRCQRAVEIGSPEGQNEHEPGHEGGSYQIGIKIDGSGEQRRACKAQQQAND